MYGKCSEYAELSKYAKTNVFQCMESILNVSNCQKYTKMYTPMHGKCSQCVELSKYTKANVYTNVAAQSLRRCQKSDQKFRKI